MKSQIAKTIAMPLSSHDFDPTEIAVTWQILTHAGHRVIFATPNGQVSAADTKMVTGEGLG
ncbi:MAG: type 1 glutamine amidotransferase domain-containing protein [Agitococcus sp.]|nr:type 1 glutamine amidotransferase domain-containing protein [Agitococcus sp.]